jgi:hypothetical protein
VPYQAGITLDPIACQMWYQDKYPTMRHWCIVNRYKTHSEAMDAVRLYSRQFDCETNYRRGRSTLPGTSTASATDSPQSNPRRWSGGFGEDQRFE